LTTSEEVLMLNFNVMLNFSLTAGEKASMQLLLFGKKEAYVQQLYLGMLWTSSFLGNGVFYF